MKLFISADIEGTAGITHWDETIYGREGYDVYRRQMTREVAAVCEAAFAIDPDAQIVIKDAHDSARNLLTDELPEGVRIFRGWAKHPFCMMFGLDESFDAAVLTGNHNAAGTNTNPLSHTMDTRAAKVTLNGELCSEALINSLTASYLGVPVVLLTGDRGVCERMAQKNPALRTVAVSEGTGSGSMSLHPRTAVETIRAAAKEALQGDLRACLLPLPEQFRMEVSYIKHHEAYSASFYPGAEQIDEKTVTYRAADWMDVLRFIHFAL
ncbi:MAG: M55 family metallopeptidase [Eubacteriales bacterium]|nr:M55 family metallopeptidase [Eubacteriales bacterium]